MSKYFIVLLLSTLSAFALSGCGGSDSATSTVTAPSALSYTSPASGTVGVAVTPLAPTVTGVVTGYTVSPALPAGLSLDSATGAISGTPTAAAPEATYTITASNSAGSTRFSWVFTVNAATALEISSLSESTAAVFSPLTITGTGFDPAHAAISVVMTPSAGGTSVVIPAYAATSTTVQIMVPPIVNSTSTSFAAATMDVQVIQVGATVSSSNVLKGLNVSAPPAVPSSDGGVGAVTAAFLTSSLNISSAIQNDATTNTALTTLAGDLKTYDQEAAALVTAINAITANPAQSITLTTTNGQSFTLNATVLALSDQMVLASLTEIVEQAGLSTTASSSQSQRTYTPMTRLVRTVRASSESCTFSNPDAPIDPTVCAVQNYNESSPTQSAAGLQTGVNLYVGLNMSFLGGWAIGGLAEGGTVLQETAEAAELVWSGFSPYLASWATGSKPPSVSGTLADTLGDVVDKTALGGLGILPAALEAQSVYEDASTVFESTATEAPTGGLLLSAAQPSAPSGTTPVYSYQAASSTPIAVPTTQGTISIGAATQPSLITVLTAGSGVGTVVSAPAGINCGATCRVAVANATVITLTATAASGSTFAGWSGGCSGTGACKITASASASVTASFTTAGSGDLTLSVTSAACAVNNASQGTDTFSYTVSVSGPVGTYVEDVNGNSVTSCGAWASNGTSCTRASSDPASTAVSFSYADAVIGSWSSMANADYPDSGLGGGVYATATASCP